MIFYFSATGNSEAVAKALGMELGDKAVSITDPDAPRMLGNETAIASLGLVFPVYGWNPPYLIYRFLDNLLRSGTKPDYLYFVLTCGDDIGKADKRLRKFLRRYNVAFNSIFSVTMPNTYVCLPGFDVDKPRVRQDKLSKVHDRIVEISRLIKGRRNTTSVTRGALPRLKTGILGWLFAKFLITDRYFHTTSECTLCKKCVVVCPQHNISVSDGKIVWGGNCTGCLSCYHHCPRKAILFGKFSDGKGQYLLCKYRHELKD
jgi:Pyruvate/2-oxoacid:ferredoxin oxidoreductase delta subunit/flavodoxin